MPKANTSNSNEGEQEDFSSQNAQGEFQEFEDDDDSQGGEEGGSSSTSGKTSQNRPVKRAGRRKINIEFIKDKSRRHITFSKRKAGIMKKAYELSTLTGTQVLLLVASETGHVYTFATPKLQPLITKTEGKNLIQACLNSPDPAPDQQGQAGTLGGDELTSSMPQTQYHQQQMHQHEPIEDERKAKKIKTEVKATAPSPYPSTPSPYPAHMASPAHHSQSIPPHHAQGVGHHGGHHQQVHHQQMHQHHLQAQQALPTVPTSQTPTPTGVGSGGYDIPTHPQSVQYANPSAYSQHALPQAGYNMHQHMQQMQGAGVPPMRSLPPNYAQMGAYAQQHSQQPPLTALYQQMQQNNTPMTPSSHQKLTISPGTTGAPLPPASYPSQQPQSGASQSSQSTQASQSQAQSQGYQLPIQSSQQQNSQTQ